MNPNDDSPDIRPCVVDGEKAQKFVRMFNGMTNAEAFALCCWALAIHFKSGSWGEMPREEYIQGVAATINAGIDQDAQLLFDGEFLQ